MLYTRYEHVDSGETFASTDSQTGEWLLVSAGFRVSEKP